MSALPEVPWHEPTHHEVVFAVGDTSWEPALLSALRHPAIRLNVSKRCLDAVELIAAVNTTKATHVVISASLARLDLDIINKLKQRAVHIVAIVSNHDEIGEKLLRQLGVESVVAADLERAGAAASALASIMKPPAAAQSTMKSAPAPSTFPEHHGELIAVWGPPGSMGKSTVAINIADEISHAGRKVLLIDADVDAPSVAPLLAIVDSPGGLPVALRRATAGRLDGAALQELSVEVSHLFYVLVGAGKPGHRAELRSPAFASLRRLALTTFDVVVLDLGAVPLPTEGLGEQASLSLLDALDEADRVLLVGGPNLIDIQRLIHNIESLKEVLPDVAADIVINRSEPRSDIATALTHHCRIKAQDLHFIPEDSKVVGAALRDGLTVRETSTRSKVRAHLQALGQELVSTSART